MSCQKVEKMCSCPTARQYEDFFSSRRAQSIFVRLKLKKGMQIQDATTWKTSVPLCRVPGDSFSFGWLNDTESESGGRCIVSQGHVVSDETNSDYVRFSGTGNGMTGCGMFSSSGYLPKLRVKEALFANFIINKFVCLDLVGSRGHSGYSEPTIPNGPQPADAK